MKAVVSFISVFLMAGFVSSAQAGNSSHGAGDVARLLENAADVTLPDILVTVTPQSPQVKDSPEIQKAWATTRVLLAVNLPIKLEMVNKPLFDTFGSYSTWIASPAVPGAIIKFNPGEYDTVVKFDQKLAQLSDDQKVTLYLLHELGHQYFSKDETSAWSFARIVLNSYIEIKTSQKISSHNVAFCSWNCRLTFPSKGGGETNLNYLAKGFGNTQAEAYQNLVQDCDAAAERAGRSWKVSQVDHRLVEVVQTNSDWDTRMTEVPFDVSKACKE